MQYKKIILTLVILSVLAIISYVILRKKGDNTNEIKEQKEEKEFDINQIFKDWIGKTNTQNKNQTQNQTQTQTETNNIREIRNLMEKLEAWSEVIHEETNKSITATDIKAIIKVLIEAELNGMLEKLTDYYYKRYGKPLSKELFEEAKGGYFGIGRDKELDPWAIKTKNIEDLKGISSGWKIENLK